MSKTRGFEVVKDESRQHPHRVLKDETGANVNLPRTIQLPTRADERSAGYDFYAPVDVTILPSHKTIVFTDVKSYMLEDEVLELYIRSSLAIKKGLMLSNNVGVVDASYYSNPDNDGNIGIALVNTSGTVVELKAGERFAQGIFKKYLVADADSATGERTGGFGSSGQ